MKEIGYSLHLKFRMSVREIPYDLPQDMYETARERYYDTLTRHKIAVQKVLYKERLRDMALTYTEDFYRVTLITIHPLKFSQKYNRIRSKRWQKL